MTEEALKQAKAEAVEKALDSLSRYKFMQFGYWAAIWVHLNKLDAVKEGNPFKAIVKRAREITEERPRVFYRDEDPELDCPLFEPGAPDSFSDCDTDGHHMCEHCRRNPAGR